MMIDSTNPKPIFLQISEGIEDAILSGAFKEEEQVPSTTEISLRYNINPATALKGMNLLVAEGLIYKKRGLGMFVSTGAVQLIKKKRQETFESEYIYPLIKEARRLDITGEELLILLKKRIEKGQEK